jgi:arylformamidase
VKSTSPSEADDGRRRYPSRAALDSEFTLDSIPDLDALRARRDRAAQVGLAEFPPVGPLSYGADPDETLLLFRAHDPAAAGNAPAQLFIHGGFWSSMRASEFAFLARGFVPFGAVLALVDYPLIPRVTLADVVGSCRKALLWLRGHAGELGIDPQRIHISGNSAGGHLVAELMDDRACDFVAGGTAISGLYDLAPVAACFRNELLALTEADVAGLSPLRRPSRVTAPLIATVGASETAEFVRQTAEYADHVRAGGAAVEHYVAPCADHITVVLDHFANPDAMLNRLVRRQMALPE